MAGLLKSNATGHKAQRRETKKAAGGCGFQSAPGGLDLLQLEACRAATAPLLPQSTTAIAMPLWVAAWEGALHTYPDQTLPPTLSRESSMGSIQDDVDKLSVKAV